MGVIARAGFITAAILVVAGVALWSVAAGLVAAGILIAVLTALFTIEVP